MVDHHLNVHTKYAACTYVIKYSIQFLIKMPSCLDTALVLSMFSSTRHWTSHKSKYGRPQNKCYVSYSYYARSTTVISSVVRIRLRNTLHNTLRNTICNTTCDTIQSSLVLLLQDRRLQI